MAVYGSSNKVARRTRARGFTLIEVLIAFMILAVAMVAILQAFSSGLRGLGAAEASAAALAHARAKLEEIGTFVPIEPGETEGDFEDGSHWTVTVRAHEGEAGAESLSLAPYEVEVTVAGTRAPAVTLRTLRLAPAQ